MWCGVFGGDRDGAVAGDGGQLGPRGRGGSGPAVGFPAPQPVPGGRQETPAGATQDFSGSTQDRAPPAPACTRRPRQEIEFITDSNTFKPIYCKITFQ